MPTTTPRRDATRNRARIIDVARDTFTTQGLDAPLDAIAKAAGVGAGTLYRHFPTRQDLIAAVLEDPRLDLERERRRIEGEATPGTTEALEQWLDALTRWMHTYDGLPAPLRAALDATSTPLGSTCDEAIAATDTFLTPLRQAGLARPDVDGRDLFLAALGLTWAAAASHDDEHLPRLTALLRQGWATS